MLITQFMKNLLRESVGFAGCKMARRMFGIAGVEDTRGIKDIKLRAKVEKQVIQIAKQFVKNYTAINSVDDVFEILIGSK